VVSTHYFNHQNCVKRDSTFSGMSAASAAMHAYLADTTTESTRLGCHFISLTSLADPILVPIRCRSRIFSLSLGFFFVGMTFGPTLGGLLIRFTGKTLSVFYAAGIIHFLCACIVWFIVPESLSLRQMVLLRHKYLAQADGEGLRARGIVKRLFAFLSPLSLLMPEISEDQDNSNPLKRKGRDWTLTLVSAAYGCTIALVVRILFSDPWIDGTILMLLLCSRELLCIPSSMQLQRLAGLRKRCVFEFLMR
jgi:MFS family permease